MSAPRVLLAEGDAITRTGLRLALQRAGFEVVADAATHASALDGARVGHPEVALVASDLPDGGIETVRALVNLDPRLKVIVLTAQSDGDELLSAVLGGAVGYLAKDISPARLPHAVRGVLAGEVALPRRHADHLLAELRRRDVRRQRLTARTGAQVTDREWEVLQMLGDGASTAEIAQRLRISQVTVRRHVSALLAKLGARDRTAALELIRRSTD
jgi:DNA-binding NarL/FixJ family response regulator